MLSSHLFLCLPRGLLPSGLPTKIMYAALLNMQQTVTQAEEWRKYITAVAAIS